jgi:CheY-like chemotaxis protein
MPLTTIRVLLVEDEVMIRMMVADMVAELGHAVAAEAGDVGRAAELAQTGLFDLTILDVNLNGKMSFPVADIIMQRRIPLIFASSYALSNIPAAFATAPKLQKPFQIQTLAKAITAAREAAIRMIKPKRTAAVALIGVGLLCSGLLALALV